jgi:hypothetical protein
VNILIEEIVRLKGNGLTLKQIADRMDLSVGKVQYRWQKYRMERKKKGDNPLKQAEHSKEEPAENVIWVMPPEYDEDTIIALPQSPTTLYVYWSLSASKQSMIEHHLRTEWLNLPKVLKIYDVTDLHFQGHNQHRAFEISLPEMTNNWFLTDLETNRTFIFDLGTRTYDGSFFTVIRSQSVETPRSDHHPYYPRHRTPIQEWKEGMSSSPNWQESVSCYSYYEKIK